MLSLDPTSPFVVQRAASPHGPVEAWACSRLPFEPKKQWHRRFYEQLRQAVRELDPCDAENLLFYNVGASHFKQATRWGLRFERGFAKPPPTGSGPPSYEHYYRYEFVPSERPFQHWHHLRVLARWTEVPCPILSSSSSPARIWWALKQAAPGMESFPSSYTPGQHFAVRLVLHLPTGEQVNLAALAKPLFDGAIAAFHHDPTPDPEVVSRLSRQLDAEPSEVRHSLANFSLAVLGSRQLVRPRLRGVQWNPADHLCVAGQLIWQDAARGPAWRLSGELLSGTSG